MSPNREKIILDTDPGIDDAMAIAYAVAHPRLDLLGLTTVFGNVAVQESTRNALQLLDYLGHDADVAEGESRPLSIPPQTPGYHVHGANGFGGIDLPASKRQATPQPAIDYLIESTRRFPGEISICAVGPLTNLARALERDPTIVQRVKQVVVMGGAITVPGNVSPAAEANFRNDPHAAEAVLAAAWPLVLAPLDATMPVVLSASYFADLADAAPKAGRLLADMAAFYSRFYHASVGVDGCVPHDVAALGWLTMPGAYLQKKGALAVTCDGPGIGQTHFLPAGRRTREPAWLDRPWHTALLDTDARLFSANFFATLVEFEASRG